MKDWNVGFIGAGRTAKILVGGWEKAGAMPARVTAYDINPAAGAALKALHSAVETAEAPAAAAGQDLVFLSVHPPVVKEALALLAGHLKPGAILVSLAPKFTCAKISELLGETVRIVRMIPNAPSIVGRGYNPVSFAPGVSPEEKQRLTALFAPLGDCPEVEERHLEAYAILSAMGPTYFWPQIQALRTLGESFGLSPAAAHQAIDKMLWGAVATLKESGLSPEQVMDLIPVKPLAEDVDLLVAAIGTKLPALMEKIRP